MRLDSSLRARHGYSPIVRFREVEGDVEILPGTHVIETSGHVTGHQSVLLHLPNTGAVLLPILRDGRGTF